MRSMVAVYPVSPPSPAASAIPTPMRKPPPPRSTATSSSARAQFFHVVYNWLLWALFTLLLFGQAHRLHERRAVHGPLLRVLAARRPHVQAVRLQTALDAPTAVIVNTTGPHVNGYRVVQREQQVVPGDPIAYAAYANTCYQIASTMGAIIELCTVLVYNVTSDVLRIVGNVDSMTMKLLRDTLPIATLPFSDNSPYSQYAIPGLDGSACMFRLIGRCEIASWPEMTLLDLNRSVREKTTVALLNDKRGTWCNGCRYGDVLFGPTLLSYYALHWFCTELAQSRWLEYDGRIASKVTSSEFERASVLDFFSGDLLLHLNGNILSLFWIKLAVLGLNLLPLLLFSRAVPADATLTQTERALGVHVSGYELLRLGYFVLGNEYVITMTDWYVLVLLSRRTTSKSTIRVVVFATNHDDDSVCFIATQKPLICQIHDSRVTKFRFWEISARSFR
uniref:Uncharacterized protein n=1 Tax=Globisporangium ultimum (strain ATCC 200006 / CBS 805.95 / DAOM BR144) TaxID=431595 RepID=K3WMN6_GLOUD